MDDPKPDRRFEQRLIDGFERSRIRHEVLRAKAKTLGPMGRLKSRYATLILGASLAVGGIGFPLKASRVIQPPSPHLNARHATAPTAPENDVLRQIAGDLETAHSIATEVASGVVSAAEIATDAILPEAKQGQPMMVTENVREQFFRSEIPFGQIIYNEAKKNDLPPELLAAVVKTESRFQPNARSHAGAQGLMQLVPRTGRWMGATNLMNPIDNVRAGAKYLKYLNERFDGDQTKMIAAYNAGEGNVRRFGGVPPFRETQRYVTKVMQSKADYHDQVKGKVVEDAENSTVAGEGSLSRTR